MKIKNVFLVFATTMCFSCSHETFDEGQYTAHFVSLKTISLTDDITYPLDIYAYDQTGVETKHITIEDSNDDASLELLTGTYKIVAVSGSMDFTNGYSDKPLMIGKADIVMTKEDVELPIVMKYAVAQVDVVLSDVPSDAEAVDVNIGSLYSTISPLGEYSGNTTITLSCSKYSDGTWRTDTVYVLPGNADNTVLTINHSSTVGNEKIVKPNSYIYPAPLKASTPYHFKGSFQSGMTYSKMSFSLSKEGWGDCIDDDFAYGPGTTEVEVVSGSTFYVEKMPTACSDWNGHVVATIDEEGNALLLSLKEWDGLSSMSVSGQASEKATNYVEMELNGWDIPTVEQFEQLTAVYRSNNFVDLNAFLVEIGADGLHFSSDEYYYLCKEQDRRYSLNKKRSSNMDSSISYYLRLVKPVTFVLK